MICACVRWFGLILLSSSFPCCRGSEAALSQPPSVAKAADSEGISATPTHDKQSGSPTASATPASTISLPAPTASASGGASDAAGPSPTPAMARAVAASWLAALAVGDRRTLERHSAPTLEVIGFQLGHGPERSGCGQDTDRLNELAARVTDGLSLAKVVDCVARDLLLVDSIPQYETGWWPETTRAPDAKGRIGYLRPLNLLSMPSRLIRYRKEVTAAAAGSALLNFFVSDRNGATAYGVIVVRLTGDEPRVASVFTDEKFEE